MRKLPILASLLLFIACGGYAQQEAQYTQFMYNKLSLNPAYAGSAKVPCISCIHRSQWIGFDGAPSSQVLNFHMPMLGDRIGLGASLAHDKIGPTNSYTASLMYAYRMEIEDGNLAIGLKGTLRSYQIDWTDLQATHSGDGEIPTGNTNRIMPNFGVGVYYETPKFYVGASLPNLINNDLSYSHLTNNTDFGRQHRHMYFMGGYLFNINRKVKFKPAALVKYVTNAPIDLDLNATFIFIDKLWTGLSYRLGGDSSNSIGESLDLLVQYKISPVFRAGVSYDFTMSKLRNHSSGTAEIQMEYCIGKTKKTKEKERLTNPRFF